MVIEKVNRYHPDKLADRIAGAITDYAYKQVADPRVAVAVLLGHGHATVIAETSITISDDVVTNIVKRISGITDVDYRQYPQDSVLAENQNDGVRCGDNGVFQAKWSADYDDATTTAISLANSFPTDGKYLFDFKNDKATICQ